MHPVPASLGRYLVRQRQGGGETLSLITDPKGGGGSDLGVLLRLLRGAVLCRLFCKTADHRTVQAQIGQIAVRQGRQLIHGPTVDAVTHIAGFDVLDHRGKVERRCVFDCGLSLYHCHLDHPFLSPAKCCGVCLRLKIGKCCGCTMVRVVNAAMQQAHGLTTFFP